MPSNKVAFITGGNRGLGYQTAIELGRLGIRVVIGSRSLIHGEQAIARLRNAGIQADVLLFDITRTASHQSAHHHFLSKFGRLDILINNAAIAGGSLSSSGPEQRASDVPLDLLRQVFETNFFAQVALTRILLPLIKKSPAGRIVNMSSILGSLTLHSDPDSSIYNVKSFAYDASKSALNALTVHLAYELRDTKVKVNSAHPGWVKTELGGPQAPLSLEEGAKTAVALATLPDDGATGGFFHLGKPLPW